MNEFVIIIITLIRTKYTKKKSIDLYLFIYMFFAFVIIHLRIEKKKIH